MSTKDFLNESFLGDYFRDVIKDLILSNPLVINDKDDAMESIIDWLNDSSNQSNLRDHAANFALDHNDFQFVQLLLIYKVFIYKREGLANIDFWRNNLERVMFFNATEDFIEILCELFMSCFDANNAEDIYYLYSTLS